MKEWLKTTKPMWRLENYINPEDFFPVPIERSKTAIHGDTLSMKVVLPVGCQAACGFCFNKHTMNHFFLNGHDYFFRNMAISLDGVFKIKNRSISVDITGGEPTFDKVTFQRALKLIKEKIEEHHPQISKVVLTTNGYNLKRCFETIDEFSLINIVNTSIHSVDYAERVKIFRSSRIPNNDDLKDFNNYFHAVGITSTAVAVVTKDSFRNSVDFSDFVPSFAAGIKRLGYDNGRIRIDYMDETSQINEDLFNTHFEGESTQILPTLKCKTVDCFDSEIKIYKGVPEIAKLIVGPEIILDNNGKLYLDYAKSKPVSPDEVSLLENNLYVRKGSMPEE